MVVLPVSAASEVWFDSCGHSLPEARETLSGLSLLRLLYSFSLLLTLSPAPCLVSLADLISMWFASSLRLLMKKLVASSQFFSYHYAGLALPLPLGGVTTLVALPYAQYLRSD